MGKSKPSVQDFTLKAQLGPPKNPARVVQPRKHIKMAMPIVVCDAELNTWFENNSAGHQWDLIEAIKYLRDNWPRDREGNRRTTPIMLVCFNPHRVFEKAHSVFKDDPEWNARFSINTSEKFHTDGKIREPKVKTTQDIRISFFGFRDDNRRTKYFHLISPYDFIDEFDKWGDETWPEWLRMYKWGGHVRKWVRKNKLKLAATRGGLSAQLLRDKRFYPNSRRKVPKLTNENARSALPGNFYIMREDAIGKLHRGVYVIDQENAHHHAVENTELPCANTLFARGRFASLSDDPFVSEKSLGFKELLKQHGLFRCRVWIPTNLPNIGSYIPPWANRPGLQNIYLYSNEMDLVQELGVEIRHISFAWTSPHTDRGLTKYAQWARGEVDRYPEHRAWIKPTLLSAYGILGARPRHMEMAFWRSDSGERHRYLLGPTPIFMQKVRTDKPIQPVIANTIHRGMIEAHTRKLSIQLARTLEDEGHNVLGIHADAVLVRDEGQQFPLLPPPWRVKDRYNFFESIDAVSYKADSIEILPGRKRKGKKRG